MTDVLPLLAWLAILPAAALSWRWSRVLALALAAVWLSTLGYLACKHVWSDVWACGALEHQRWVSAAAGLAGALVLVEYGRHPLYIVRHGAPPERAPAGMQARVLARSRTVWLAAMLVGSMAADGAAHLVHRGAGLWVLPGIQLLALGAMCLVSAWPRRS